MRKLTFLILINIPLLCFAPILTTDPNVEAYNTIEYRAILSPFNEELFKEALSYYLECPDTAMAQAILETGNFTSDIFLQNNNCFGMRHPRQRETTSNGELNHFATYDHWTNSVKDYALFIKYYMDKGKDWDYIFRVYCPAPSYKSRVMNIYDELNTIWNQYK